MYALQPNLNMIGNISSNTSILILQGENETQTPLQEAFLFQERKLTDVGHPDHILITYPNLGHIFSPSSQWITGVGPIQQYVLVTFIHGLKLILVFHSSVTNTASAIGANTSSLNTNKTS